jgi:hypothetical protein
MDKSQPFSKMNIETLMPSYNHNYNKSKRLDVYTISHGSKINVEPEKDFDSNELLNSIIERRKKLRNWLVDMYNQCCYKIKEADAIGLTDIMFELPDIILENSSFKHKDAIEYISKNLRTQNIDTLILKDNKLFITWKYIELNKEKLNI